MSVVGDTLIVQVWRPSDTSSSRAAAGGPASDFDYGKDFEKVVTRIPEHLDRPEFENHSRLVRYKLGNLDMAVLLNLDALYPGVDAGGASTLSWAEIKTTCKNERGENIQRAIVQQWFGRTSHLILGVHSRGFLLSTRVMDCTEQLLLWEKLHQESLQMMPALFSELRNIAKATEFKTITVLSGYGPSNDEPNLRIYAHNLDQGAPGFFLPKHLINQFWTPDPNGLDRRFA
ncbi:hypothetical protein QBC43DRAFT_319958 [Cladorrhinum sp. PSN259]|nr:hypothetical protein QBC43DRAFT_319958 [Cladorrhinum sp. PSN259]